MTTSLEYARAPHVELPRPKAAPKAGPWAALSVVAALMGLVAVTARPAAEKPLPPVELATPIALPAPASVAAPVLAAPAPAVLPSAPATPGSPTAARDKLSAALRRQSETLLKLASQVPNKTGVELLVAAAASARRADELSDAMTKVSLDAPSPLSPLGAPKPPVPQESWVKHLMVGGTNGFDSDLQTQKPLTPEQLILDSANRDSQAAANGPTMKPSEAIELGAQMKPQAYGALYKNGGSCAIGAAMDAERATGKKVDWEGKSNLQFAVMALNDGAHWTREKIAGLLRSVGL